ncbi:hypothetical protein BD414DRAFT_145750 [Trametes punicea]|nr:hypothetical protein BD414DRAFT_145750 [Trametes punicea]
MKTTGRETFHRIGTRLSRRVYPRPIWTVRLVSRSSLKTYRTPAYPHPSITSTTSTLSFPCRNHNRTAYLNPYRLSITWLRTTSLPTSSATRWASVNMESATGVRRPPTTAYRLSKSTTAASFPATARVNRIDASDAVVRTFAPTSSGICSLLHDFHELVGDSCFTTY